MIFSDGCSVGGWPEGHPFLFLKNDNIVYIYFNIAVERFYIARNAVYYQDRLNPCQEANCSSS